MGNDDTELQQHSIFNRIGSTLPRRFVLVLLLAAGVYLLIPQLAGVSDALRLIRQASALPLLAAVSCQAFSILSHTLVVQRILLAFAPRIPLRKVLQVTLASGFASMFIPSIGLSGLAVRGRYLGEHGYTVEATLFTFYLEAFGQATAYCLIVALALLWQTLGGQAVPWQPLALLVSITLLGSISLALILADPRRRDWRYALLAQVNKICTRGSRLPIPDSELEQRLTVARQSVLALSTQARLHLLLGNLGRGLGTALCLHMTLLAFDQHVPLHLTIINHTLSDMLGGASSIPGGLLVTETSLSALLANAGVPLSAAIAATLSFRLIALWLPRVLGLATWYNLQRHSARPLW